MAVMFAFLAGAAAAGTTAVLGPALKWEPLRWVIVDVLATAYRAGDVSLEATADVRKELAALDEEARVRSRVAQIAKAITPPGPAVKVV